MTKRDTGKIKKEIEESLREIKNKKSEEVRKIKKKSMSINYKIKEKKKEYCRKCLTPYTNETSTVRIKKGMKIIKCKKCGEINKWKINND